MTTMAEIRDVDTSSAKGMFGSIITSSARKNVNPAPPPVTPAAFAQKKNRFGPPPVRRATSNTADSPPPIQRHQQEEEEEETHGEWADALYDYESAVRGSEIVPSLDLDLLIWRTGCWRSESQGQPVSFSYRTDFG
jgi:abl interactor 2